MQLRRLRPWPGVVLAAVSLLPSASKAQDVDVTGQIRPRYESRTVGGREAFTSMRVRLGIRSAPTAFLELFIQPQDVRLWGEETSTAGDFRADNLDIHQAYIRYRPAGSAAIQVTVGRQETRLGGERLVGAVDWLQQGRSFDGVRGDVVGGRVRVTVLGHVLADATAPAHSDDAELYGLYVTTDAPGAGAVDLYFLHDRKEGTDATAQNTAGARYAFAARRIAGRVEASVQRGERDGRDVAAWMVGGRVGTATAGGRARLTLWYDLLSGTDPGADGVGVFSTLYATNHKFYGFADLFTDIPAHTGGRGLHDAAVKLALQATPNTSVAADLHRFSAAESEGLPTGHFADELDLTLTHMLSPTFRVIGGLSRVWTAEGLRRVGRLSEDVTFLYLMLDAAFD